MAKIDDCLIDTTMATAVVSVFEKGKKRCALVGDVGQRIKVIAGTTGTEIDSGAEKQMYVVVNRRGEVEEEKAGYVFLLKKKVIEDGVGLKGGRKQTFVNNGSFNCEYHVPSRAGKTEELLKLCMFINQKGKLVMQFDVQKEGFVWSSKTFAQRE